VTGRTAARTLPAAREKRKAENAASPVIANVALFAIAAFGASGR
jgi:hypothetical protein